MEKSSFFNSINGDRRYKAEEFASYFASFIGNGVFPNPSTNLQVVAKNDMTITVKKGKAWIEGYYYENTDDFTLKIDVADSLLNRIDRIVLRLDYSKRAINLTVKKGEFSSNAQAKELQRDNDAYEIALADISINKGAISITQTNITDLRLNNELCGIVHGTVEQVDTTAIFNQFQNWYTQTKNSYDKDIENWTKEKKQAFDEWFSDSTSEWSEEFQDWFVDIKNVLSGDIAGKLTLEVNKINDKIIKQEQEIKKNSDKVDNIELTATKVTVKDIDNNFVGDNVEEALQETVGLVKKAQKQADTALNKANEAFQSADNGKNLISETIGQPLSANDQFSTMSTKIQTMKNAFVENLSAKGQSANENENLFNLIEKVKDINTGKRFAKGTIKKLHIGIPIKKTISNLKFKPSIVIVSYSVKLSYYFDDYGYTSRMCKICIKDISNRIATVYNFNEPDTTPEKILKLDMTTIELNSDSFTINFSSGSDQYSIDKIKDIEWIAIE